MLFHRLLARACLLLNNDDPARAVLPVRGRPCGNVRTKKRKFQRDQLNVVMLWASVVNALILLVAVVEVAAAIRCYTCANEFIVWVSL